MPKYQDPFAITAPRCRDRRGNSETSGYLGMSQFNHFHLNSAVEAALASGDLSESDLGLPPTDGAHRIRGAGCDVFKPKQRRKGSKLSHHQMELRLAEEANRILREAGHSDLLVDEDEKLLEAEVVDLVVRWAKTVNEAVEAAVPDQMRWAEIADEREGAIEAAWQRVCGNDNSEANLTFDLWAGREDRTDKNDHLGRPPVDVDVEYELGNRQPAKLTFKVEQADYDFRVQDPREIAARRRTQQSPHVQVWIGAAPLPAVKQKQQCTQRFELRRDDLLAIRQACHRLDDQGRKAMADLLVYSVDKAGLSKRVASFAESHPAAVFSLVAEALGSDALSTGNKPDWSQLNAFRTAVREELVAMNHQIATYTIDEIVKIVTSGEMSWLSAIKALAAEADCRLTLCQRPAEANARFNQFQSIKNARDEKKRDTLSGSAGNAGGRKLKRVPRKQKTNSNKGRPGRDDHDQPRARS